MTRIKVEYYTVAAQQLGPRLDINMDLSGILIYIVLTFILCEHASILC